MPDGSDPLALMRPDRWPAPPAGLSTADLVFAAIVGLAVGLLIAALVALLRRRPPARPRTAALAALKAAGALPPAERLAAEAQALRQYAAAVAGEDAARLEGEAWLATLDHLFATTLFTAGDGRRLVDGLYRPDGAVPVGAPLIRLVGKRGR
ncbi:DUF4381 family protein [Mongoliimonas terrestris]|uniref:DUF4381 family protein n=1 Tax=Mongoliimonas terrestris TaxID=1709001 RepID=UPI0009499196|nr:DUF4381 family protein [Mongoliimonas terrestris]